MKTTTRLLPLLVLAASFASGSHARAQAHDHDHSAPPAQAAAGQLVAPKEADAAWLAKARAEYPLQTCSVSGEALGGDMGGPIDRIFRQPGQPDRLIRFCCKDCVDDFNKNPAKYLKTIDDAAAAKAKGK